MVKLAVAIRDIISNNSASPGFDSRPMQVAGCTAFGLVKLLLEPAETSPFIREDDRFCSEVTPICLDEEKYSMYDQESLLVLSTISLRLLPRGYRVLFPRFRCIRTLAYCMTKDRSPIVHNTITIRVVFLYPEGQV